MPGLEQLFPEMPSWVCTRQIGLLQVRMRSRCDLIECPLKLRFKNLLLISVHLFQSLAFWNVSMVLLMTLRVTCSASAPNPNPPRLWRRRRRRTSIVHRQPNVANSARTVLCTARKVAKNASVEPICANLWPTAKKSVLMGLLLTRKAVPFAHVRVCC